VLLKLIGSADALIDGFRVFQRAGIACLK